MAAANVVSAGTWGDSVEEDVGKPVVAVSKKKENKQNDQLQPLPEPQTIIENDLKKIISYSRNAKGEIEKKTRYFKIEVRKTTSNQRVLERRKWTKFGNAAGFAPGPDGSQTTISDDVYLMLRSKNELTDAPEGEKNPALIGQSVTKCRHCGRDHWTRNCPYKDMILDTDKTEVLEEAAPASTSGRNAVYVPPSHRAGAGGAGGARVGYSMDSTRDDATIRVTNLSESTQESDLRLLFSPFGALNRVYLAKDRVTDQARGFAFITYYNREDAQRAIDAIHGHGYDHLILQVEWSKQKD